MKSYYLPYINQPMNRTMIADALDVALGGQLLQLLIYSCNVDTTSSDSF